MKVAIALVAASAGIAAAQPHRHHRHHHVEKRDAESTEVYAPGPTVVVYELNGSQISEDECSQGIKNGTLVWANGGLSSVASAPAASTPTAATAYSSPVSIAEYVSSSSEEEQTSTPAPYTSVETPTTTSVYVAPTPTKTHSHGGKHHSSGSSSSGSSSSSSSTYSGTSSGIDADFPDGEIDCGTFPSDYGAITVDWVGLGGWTGIQSPGTTSSSGFDDIMTVTESQCSGKNCCQDGTYCSYACPAGYQKSQWPTLQGATGQSVGGLECKNGKLYLTNPSMSKKLCMTGTDKVSIKVQNKLGECASVCRTDYPGLEAETVPLDTQNGNTYDLTCPDGDNYYSWEGKPTSAQYYVNPKGVSVEDACQWGSSANPWGNYAPLNLGVGYSSGSAWLSIFQNYPTTTEKLDYTVEIIGDNLSGKCKYSNGQYCSGDNYSDCNTQEGCTVSVSSGTATFVLY